MFFKCLYSCIDRNAVTLASARLTGNAIVPPSGQMDCFKQNKQKKRWFDDGVMNLFSAPLQDELLHKITDDEIIFTPKHSACFHSGAAASVLQKAQVRIINQDTCNSLMGGQLTSRMLCAGVLSGGIDACQVRKDLKSRWVL